MHFPISPPAAKQCTTDAYAEPADVRKTVVSAGLKFNSVCPGMSAETQLDATNTCEDLSILR